MKKYSHLTEHERYQISALHKSGHNNAFIAKHLARNPSTISRELAINKGFRGYRPKQAHSLAQARKSTQNARRLTPFYWAYVDLKTRLSKITYAKSKTSSEVHHALINVFKGLQVKTITFDNGKEFSQHIELDKKLSYIS